MKKVGDARNKRKELNNLEKNFNNNEDRFDEVK